METMSSTYADDSIVFFDMHFLCSIFQREREREETGKCMHACMHAIMKNLRQTVNMFYH